MDNNERQALRKMLLQYPDVTEETVDEQIYAYEQREVVKKALIEDRGFSNALAEAWLDRSGYPRPPGWKSVFFYPGSIRLRNKLISFLVMACCVALWLFLK
ncbi:MAG: hypothetical protein LPK58_07950 [Gammaproteobacteria bacterium]|nr:hypothetical protein [Chromatiales bacterium]MDX5333965.1 hypothetical protein [Gammaproteobacteria bacterium]MDX5375476.1 hypothetical protein [Gammaproteobacteria bacterium]